jgi:uncharacterized repeat protein (TIGR01451 family)
MSTGKINRLHWALGVLVAAALASVCIWPIPAGHATESVQPPADGWLFVENVGQYDAQARFLLLNGQDRLWLAQDGLWLTVLREPASGMGGPTEGVNLRLSFVGANPQPALESMARQPAHVSYFVGKDPAAWSSDVPVWSSVRYRNLYPGIDLLLGGDQPATAGRLPWRIESGAGANLDSVRLRIEGAVGARLVAGGLRLDTDVGEILLPLPVLADIDQEGRARQAADLAAPSLRTVAAHVIEVHAPFSEAKESGGFPEDNPDDLDYSGFLGGAEWDWAFDIAIDTERAAYVTGSTVSADFPSTPGAFDPQINGQDAFVAKISPDGSSLEYATFLGGSSTESGSAIALEAGRAFVAGRTLSTDFPCTVDAFDTTCGTDGLCDGGMPDVYLAKLNATGTALLYGTYLGGGDQDLAYGVAVESGTAYLTGETSSEDFPTTDNAYDTTCGTDGQCDPVSGVPLADVFVVRIDPVGAGQGDLLYSTFLGGRFNDIGRGIAAEAGSAYVAGRSNSFDFPAPGYQGNYDAFAVHLDPAGNGDADLIYGTFVGGAAYDGGESIAVSNGVAYFTGETRSTDFPVTGDAYNGGFNDAFVVRLDTTGAWDYSTCLGGSLRDLGRGIVRNTTGGVVLTGYTESSDFPTTPDGYDLSHNGDYDAFVLRMNLSAPDPLLYSTFLGADQAEEGYSVAVDGWGYAYVAGYTRSPTFPVTPGSFGPTFGGERDTFVSRVRVGPGAAIAIEKHTNGQDADGPPGVYIASGDPVTWTYVVTNVGQFELASITVEDDQGVWVSCPTDNLAPDEWMECTASGTAGAGQYANIGTVSGTVPGGLLSATESDPSHYFGSSPEVALQKRTDGRDADVPPGPYIEAGELVTWTYLVTNTGNVPLTIAVTDDQGVTVACPYTSLAPSMTVVCTATDVSAAGQYSNTGMVIGTPPAPLEIVGAQDPSHYFGSQPGIALDKLTNGESADTAPGVYILANEPVTWTYLVTNTGNVTLSDVTVGDDRGMEVACPGATLAPSATMVCTATGMAVTGQYSNTGIVTGTPPVGDAVTASDLSYYYGAELALTLEKLTNGQDADLAPGPYIPVGDPVSWSYRVTNSSNVTLTGILVTDDQGVNVTCPATTLAPEEGIVCTADGTAQAGQYANLGVASGEPPGELPLVEAQDVSHYFGTQPGIALEKFTNGQSADAAPGVYILAGEPVTWTYLVTNTGNVTLTGVLVSDNEQGTVGCPESTLGPDAAMECEATGVVVTGPYSNTGAVTGIPPGGMDAVEAWDIGYYFGVLPSLLFEKRTNGEDADEPPGPVITVGQPVTWTYYVTNTGNISLTTITVIDTPEGVVDCPTTTLGLDASIVCTATGSAEEGPYANAAIVSGLAPEGTVVTATEASHYFGFLPAPSITIQKRTNGVDADQPPGPYIPWGNEVLWTYEVANSGNVTLTQIVVTDTRLVTVSCPTTTLGTIEVMECSASGTAEPGPYDNVGYARGTSAQGGGEVVTDSDPSHYFGTAPDLALEKHTNGEDADTGSGPFVLVGQPVTWTYLVTNTGNVELNAVLVSDDQGLAVTCPSTTLVPSATMVCTATGVAATGPYTNTGWVEALPNLGGVVTDTDPSHYYGTMLALTLVKSTNGEDADLEPGPRLLVGEPVTWTYQVTNGGNVALSSVTVTDSQEAVVACPDHSLPAGASMVCTATGWVEAGQYGNSGVVRGTPPGGLQVMAEVDESHYFGADPGIVLEKHTNGEDADEPPGPSLVVGQPVTWTYRVTNTGNVTLTGVTVSDFGLAVDCPVFELGASESMVCTATGWAELGLHENLGVVEATYEDMLIEDSDPSHYRGVSSLHYVYLPLVLREVSDP